MTNDCKRWAELSDRWALEQDLSEAEGSFLKLHCASCVACSAEQRVWEGLGVCLVEHAAVQLEAGQESRSSLFEREGARHGRPALLMWTAGLTSALAAASLLLFWIFTSGAEPTSHRAVQGRVENPRSFAQVLLVSGDVILEGSKPSAGASLGEADTIVTGAGRACLTHGAGTTTCLEHQSKGRILEARAGAQRMELSAGTLFLWQSPGAASLPFEVKTRWGTIVGAGAEFITGYASDDSLFVTLLKGELRVRHSSGSESVYSGPGDVSLNAAGVSRATTQRITADLLPRRLMDHWSQPSLTPISLDSEPAGAVVMIDGAATGNTPLSMMVARGTYELEISSQGFTSQRRTLEVKGAEQVTEMFALKSLDREEARTSSVPPAKELSAAQLLTRAQTYREQGRFGEAARAYQTILTRHAASSEAAATLLSLGELQLSQLGAPAAALGSFRKYLKSGGVLRQEASYGEIRALRALGREEEARSLARKFSSKYPDSGQAVSLLRWLESSERPPSR